MTSQSDRPRSPCLAESTEIVLVSDVHLRGTDDLRHQLLCDLIKQCIASRPHYFILLGDIFDFFFGEQSYYLSKYTEMKTLLEQLAATGTQVLYFEGNHEFHLSQQSWKSVQIVTEPTKVVTLSNGKRVALAHGDLVYAHTSYIYFRAFIKSRFVRYFVSLFPAVWLENYALQHARVSRASDSYRKLDLKQLIKASATWMKQHDAQIGIIGHFHIPFNETTENAGQLISVNAWDKINFLCINGDNVSRGFYKKGEGWSIEPAPQTHFGNLSLRKH